MTSIFVTLNMVHWPVQKPSRSSGSWPEASPQGYYLRLHAVPISCRALPVQQPLSVLSLSFSSQSLTAMFLPSPVTRLTGADTSGGKGYKRTPQATSGPEGGPGVRWGMRTVRCGSEKVAFSSLSINLSHCHHNQAAQSSHQRPLG